MADPLITEADALQMVSAPSSGFSAGQWCEAANVLADALERSEQARQDAEKALRIADDLVDAHGRHWRRDDKFYAYWETRRCPTCGDPASEAPNNGQRECSDIVHFIAGDWGAAGSGDTETET